MVAYAALRSIRVSRSFKLAITSTAFNRPNQRMAQEATCCICTETYDSIVRCPRVLRCGHSLCQSCLGRLLRCGAAKACPECRFDIRPNRIADFPKNFALLQHLPANPAEPVVAPCENSGCGGGTAVAMAADAQEPAGNLARRRKRPRRSQRRRSEPPDLVRDFARAWHVAHRNFASCGCQACAEWAHGLLCRCDGCDKQMQERGIMCVVCNQRYHDYGWNFGYCSRGCWSVRSSYIYDLDW
jgi:hypothetical protein